MVEKSMMAVVYIFILTIVFSANVQSSGTNLKQVNIVYRHGDRSPIEIFPKDVNQVDKWPQGLGWLSTIGMKQHYSLGQYLKQRYVETARFLNASYRHDEIIVESSDEERCLMSAYCDLAGLYPPAGDQIWDAKIQWQPIPVHTKPRIEDNYLNMGETCPRYQQLMDETLRSFNVTEEEKENRGFYEFVDEMTGWSHDNISTIWRVADTLICEKHHNLTRNDWVNETVFAKLQDLEAYQFTLMFNSVEKARLKGGPLLKDFITNMQASKAGIDQVKLHMYSGHDTTVAALLSALGLYDGKSPSYAAAVIVELHQDLNKLPYVNIFYKNVTDLDTAVQLTLPGCTLDCPLDQFVSLTKHVIPVDWNLECGNSDSSNGSHKTLSTAWIVAITLGCLLLLNVGIMAFFCIKKRRERNSGFSRFEVAS